jgi:hypothetical protein
MTHHHHHHNHNHNHDHDIESTLSFDEKMIKLLEHWIKHNDDHAETYKDWAKKAKEKNMDKAGALLEDDAYDQQKIRRSGRYHPQLIGFYTTGSSSGPISARHGYCLSFSEMIGCSTGQLIPMSGSDQRIPPSSSGAKKSEHLYKKYAISLSTQNP